LSSHKHTGNVDLGQEFIVAVAGPAVRSDAQVDLFIDGAQVRCAAFLGTETIRVNWSSVLRTTNRCASTPE
jgi:hypothetical protein